MSDIPTRADVVVIGGGPAGSLCSGYLTQAGFDVCLLEKVTHPRPIVGESLLPHFWRYMDHFGNAASRIQDAHFVKKAGGIVQWDGVVRRTRFGDFGHDRPALHVDRDIFDKILLDETRACGTKVFEETQVMSVDADDADTKVVHYRRVEDGERGEIRATHVVDASGQAALLARQFGIRVFDEELRFTAIWGYMEGGSYLDWEANVRPMSERFEVAPVTTVSSVSGGWCWQIPLKKNTSVGLVLPSEIVKAGGGSLDDRFRRRLEDVLVTRELMRDAELIPGSVSGIRDYAYKPVTLVAGGCYLIGDAAAFVDPINSSGITFGMYAAFRAAQAIEAAMKRPDRREAIATSFETHYRDRLNVFRLVALPEEANVSEQEMEEMTEGFRWFSNVEQQLALTTTLLTNRPSRVRDCMKRLGVPEEPICEEIELPDDLM